MQQSAALSTLQSLGYKDSFENIRNIADGRTALLRGDAGKFAAVSRRGEAFDVLVIGADAECPVGTLREFLESAIIPMSDEYAIDIGVAKPERETLRKRIREAAVALDVLAKGQKVRVRPADLTVHPQVLQYVENNKGPSIESVPEHLENDLALINQLQTQVLHWKKEIDRLVQLSRVGPGSVLSAEEETMFWSSLDAALVNVQISLTSRPVQISLQLLARNRRATGFMMDVSQVLDTGRLRAAGVLNLVQGLPIVALRTADSEESLLEAAQQFWNHMLSKLRISSLPIERAMSLTDSLSAEVDICLTEIQKCRGGLLNVSFESFSTFVEASCAIFEAWSESYDRFRMTAREIASKRAEALPARMPPRFAPLRTRIEEAFEFRSHNSALRAVLEKQSGASPSAEVLLNKLDAAYQSVISQCDAGFALDTSALGISTWLAAHEEYCSKTEDIEEAIAVQFQETVCRMHSLPSMATFAKGFAKLVDRPFMEHATGVCALKVLSIGGSTISVLRKQWEAYRPEKTGLRFRYLPEICTKVIQGRVISNALRKVLDESLVILGSVRMRNDPEIVDFVYRIEQFCKQTDAVALAKPWLFSASEIVATKTPLLFSAPSNNILELEVGINEEVLDCFRAVFFFEQDAVLSSHVDHGLLTRARNAQRMFQVHSLLSSALSCYSDTSALMQTVETKILGLIHPLVSGKQDVARQSLLESSKLFSDDSPEVLLNCAANCFSSCRLYSDSLRALVDEHQFLVESLDALSSFCFNLDVSEGSNGNPEQVEVLLQRMNQTMRSMRDRASNSSRFEEYLRVFITKEFYTVFDAVLAKSIRHWGSTLQSGGVTAFASNLRLSGLGDQCLIDPDESIIHASALNELRRVLVGAHDLLSSRMFLGEEDPLRQVHLPSLDACFGNNTDANKALRGVMKYISQELEKLTLGSSLWSRFSFVFSLDKTALIDSVSTNIERAHEIISSLSSVLEEIRTLEHSEDVSVYLKTTTVSTQLQTSVASTIRDSLEACSELGAAQTHEIYNLFSKSKSAIKNDIGNDAIDVLLHLNSIEESVLKRSGQKVSSLHDIEKLICKTPHVPMPNSWIGFDVLSAEFKMLKTLHSQRMDNVFVNGAELEKKYEKERENFEIGLSRFHSRSAQVWEQYGSFPLSENHDPSFELLPDSSESLDSLQEEVKSLKHERLRVTSIERALDLEESSSSALLESLIVDVDKVCQSLEKLRELGKRLSDVSHITFETFDSRSVRKQFEDITTDVTALENLHGTSGAVTRVRSIIDNHLKVHGLLSNLRTCNLSALRERDVLMTVFGEQSGSDSVLQKTLGDFWRADLSRHDAYLREVFDIASGESALAEFMNVVRRNWSSRQPSFVLRDGLRLLDGIPALVDELHDQLQALSTMAGSQFVALFEEERKSWEVRLARSQEVLEKISEVQIQWLHLHSLFEAGSAGSSLRKKLQKEYIAFSNVNAHILSFYDSLAHSSGLVEGLNAASGLDRILCDLGEIVRCLSTFLEGQRSAFPRFFFMSDADLLLVLSMSPNRIDSLIPSLGKLFPGIGQLTYKYSETGDVTATAIISKEGEKLPLCRSVRFSHGVSITDFLASLDKTMKKSLEDLLPRAISVVEDLVYVDGEISEASLRKTLQNFPCQILLLSARIVFTRLVDGAFSESSASLENILRVLTQNLDSLCSCRLSNGAKERRSGPTDLKREHVIKDLVYQRDTIRNLVSRRVSDESAHEWSHQFRVYLETRDGNFLGSAEKAFTVVVKCAEAKFDYGWEYLGVGDTLVQTPLTSRCYLTLSQALHRGLGGSPFGPAGTGKTETVKSLGRLLGRNVVVFNCDESFDSVSVGRILAGVSRVGFWVCFDEFNRLSASSLSATSQHLTVLQTAVKSGYRSVENFYGGDLPISIGKGLGIFITMNPTYSGRRELPSNLKSLFRPCAMPRPDYLVIAEVLLLSYGFRNSLNLGEKLVHLFDCLRRVVRARPHYDFGLRSLKSAIGIAGHLRNSFSRSQGLSSPELCTEVDEDRAVVLSLHETVKPRLLPEDVDDYIAYIENLFPSVATSSLLLPEALQNAVLLSCKERNLHVSQSFLDRMGQVYNLLKHRPGVMLVGHSGCGKSVTWQVLFESMRRVFGANKDTDANLDRTSSLIVLDPKLLSPAQLYGSLDPTTREWTDGIFTKRLRECSMMPDLGGSSTSLHWIVFDGDIDPNWVENLNSVLDDTKLLTLPSGERIPLSSNIRILFEVDNLKHANPSTVSRCGLVYFDDGETISAVLKSKLSSIMTNAGILPHVSDEILRISCVFSDFAATISSYGHQILDQPKCSLVSGITTLFSSMLTQLLISQNPSGIGNNSSSAVEKSFARTASGESMGSTLSPSTLAHCFLFSVKTAIGSSFAEDDSIKLYTALLSHMAGCSRFLDAVLDGLDGISMIGTAFDCRTKSLLKFNIACADEVMLENLPGQIGSPDIVIPTASSMRLIHIVRDAIWNQDMLHKQQSMVILCGPPGCGKSMVLTSALNELAGVELATISMSSRTTIQDIVAVLKAHMDVSKDLNGEISLCPKAPHRQTVLFCDEVNLGEPDEYGTQHSACFLRSLVEQQGFWSGNPACWTNVKGLRVVAACNPAEDAGRHQLPPRLMRHAILIRVAQPNRQDLLTIFKVHVSGLLRYLDVRLESRCDSLTNAMVDFFLANKEKFAPAISGPLEAHYVYSARELIRWIRGMKHILTCNMDSPNLFSSSGNPAQALEKVWEEIVRAFSHEARRLFLDRLVSGSHQCFGEDTLAEVLKTHFGHDGSRVPDIMYSSWLKCDGDEAYAVQFQVVHDIEEFRGVVYQKLRVFAEEEGLGGAWMSGRGAAPFDDAIDQFAVTNDVLKHLARIERVLSLPLGHAVLMGVPGTGKKTLARFAAWMVGATLFQVRSHASYTAQDFANDIRDVLRQAGIYHRKMVVIFDESNDLDSAFLEMMNSILACGDVPGLFEGEDKVALLKEVQENVARSSSFETHGEALYKLFLDGVRENLHVIFSIPIVRSDLNVCDGHSARMGTSKDFTSRSPALYNRCIVDWFGDWDSSTLESIADLKLEVSRGEEREAVVQSAVRMHNIAKQHFRDVESNTAAATPRHYLEFMEQLNRIALEKAQFIQEGAGRLSEGLQKLRHAGIAVDDLKESLSEKAVHLSQKEAEAHETLRQMSEEQRLAEKSKIDAEKLATAAEEAAEAARVQQEEVTLQLADVEPKVIAAREAVGSIRKENLEELRAMPNPPSSVRAALDAVLILLDAATQKSIGSYSWGQIRSRMRDRDFIPSILNFDTDLIPGTLRRQIEKKIMNNKDFDIQRISYASLAAGPLAEWTSAILDYAAVQESVAPLREEVDLLQGDVDDLTEKNLEAKQTVSMLEARIEQCRSQYAVLVGEAERVRREIQDAEGKLVQAEEMLDSLSDEWERWVSEMKKFNAEASTVWGNAVFASAFVAYAGPLDQQQRKALCEDWNRALIDEGVGFDSALCLSTFLTSSEDRAFWTRQSLPVDETSLQNYAILLRSARYPLIVDPSGKSSDLLQSIMGLSNRPDTNLGRTLSKRTSVKQTMSSSISVTSFAQSGKKSYMRAVESAVRFGTNVLIEHAERFDYTVLPLLGQESSFGNSGDFKKKTPSDRGQHELQEEMKRSQQRLVRLGERDVALSPGFRMFLSTTNIAEVPAAALSRSSVVSFALSAAALKSKCISRTLTALQPAIEEQRTSYIIASLACEQRKKELEDSLLQEISNAEDVGTELLTGTLLSTLTNLKEETVRVSEQEQENSMLAEEAKQYEEKFQNLSCAALSIYHVLERLELLSPLYQFSAAEFFSLFDVALVKATKAGSDPAPSPFDIHRELVRTVYLHVVPSLFPQHKLSFSGALVIGATQFRRSHSEDCLRSEDIAVLRTILTKTSQGAMPLMPTNPQDRKLVEQLSSIAKTANKSSSSCQGEESFVHNVAQPLLDILNVGTGDVGVLPQLFDSLGSILPGGKNTLHGSGTRSDVVLSSLMTSLASSERLSSNSKSEALHIPLLLCSKGANSDPCELVTAMATQLSLAVESIALSNEHTPEVLGNILATVARRKSGEPLVLLMKNVHLASRRCCERLKREIGKYQRGLPYLLIMAAEVTSGAPQQFVDLAVDCRVLAFEVPSSLRTNLSRCHAVLNASLSDDWLRRAYIATTWLHGALLERRQYSPIGFSKPYSFSEGDLVSAWNAVVSQHQSSTESNSEESVMALIHLLSSSVYGGRVEHQADVQVLHEFVSDLLHRVLWQEKQSPNVSVVDPTCVRDGIIIEVNDPLMSKVNDNLPLLAPTDWFGMPPKTSESYKIRQGRSILSIFLGLLPCQGEKNEVASDALNSADAKEPLLDNIEAVLKTLPVVAESTESRKKSTALERYFSRELELCIECVDYIRADLTNLRDAVNGSCRESPRSVSLRKAATLWNVHCSSKIPEEWECFSKYAGGTRTIRTLTSKLNTGYNWILSKLSGNASEEKSVNVELALRPSSLITALGQFEAQIAGVPENTLQLMLGAQRQIEGCASWSVKGLVLEGGQWSSSMGFIQLSDGAPNELRNCSFWWGDPQARESFAKKNGIRFILLPLYTCSSRGKLVREIFVPVDPSVAIGKWRLSATAVMIKSQ